MSLKRFSVVFPLAASLAAIGIVVGKAALFGVVHEADEHLFQLLMVSQVPVVTYFAIVWLPKAPSGALRVLGAQAGAMAAALAAVFFLT